ncbi:hypothetical protein [Candidatus Avelusimicrobium fimicolum]|uniref:hypothetical protein n=1 Tax=Candidatus Avelusimicrobium fimicolum TaxID=3416216 RepID=UPI003D0E9123
MPQYFKGDDLEVKVSGAANEVFRTLFADMTAWFARAYNGAGLGAILYDDNRVPLSRNIERDIFIKNYGDILRRWEYVGSFESYLFVFTQIFGPSTIITFECLAPGALKINITTNQMDLFKWLDKLGGSYISTHTGQNINLRTLAGIGNFYEVQSVLDSLNPAGLYLSVDFKLVS